MSSRVKCKKEDLILLREFVALHFKFDLNIYEL